MASHAVVLGVRNALQLSVSVVISHVTRKSAHRNSATGP